MEEFILLCQKASSLEFQSYLPEYKRKIKEDIVLQDKDFFSVLCLLIQWLKFFQSNKIDNPELLRILLERWDHENDENNDCEGVIGDLASSMLCPIGLLQYICETLEGSIQILSILDYHIRTRYGSGIVFSFMAERLLDAFGLENLDSFEWDHLEDTAHETLRSFQYDPRFLDRQNYSETRDNKDVLEYIASKRKQIQSMIYAEIPKWISIKENETPETYQNRDVGTVEEDETFLQSLQENVSKIVDILPNEKEEPNPDTYIPKMEKRTDENPEYLSEMITSLKENSRNNKEEFPVERFYGPANSILGSPCPTSKGGPCRMFYCLCRGGFSGTDDEEIEDLTEYSPQSWFQGKCEECEKSIRKFRYALRFPVFGGGWAGCFCSFECMKKSNIRPMGSLDQLRMKEIYGIIEEIGVFDY